MVKHVLADGSEVKDISGKVVRSDLVRGAYDLMAKINEKERGRRGKNEKEE